MTRLVGGHVSAAGGIRHAVERGDAIGASVIQIFSNSPRSWKAAPISQEGFAGFGDAMDATGSGVRRVVSHVSYLVNIASPDRELYERSLRVLRETLAFCGSIGVSAAVLHVGSHRGTGFGTRLGAISDAINSALAESRSVKLLLENSAGAGDSVGSSFAELATIIGKVDEAHRMGLCLDTQHLFAAGCDYRDEPAAAAARIADELPTGIVQAIHLN
nr:deoxyribonuclease IV [Actinomycetota bacterium]